MVVLAVALIAAFWQVRPTNGRGPADSIADAGSVDSAAVPATGERRLVYRHSVIPGGVTTPEELGQVMGRDAVVAAHYAGLDAGSLRVEYLRDVIQAHVSYRIGDDVYWTKRPVTIRIGERVLTNGSTMIRARCGNAISLEPMLPVSDSEPPLVELDSLGEPSLMAVLPPAPHVGVPTVVGDPGDPTPTVTVPPGFERTPTPGTLLVVPPRGSGGTPNGPDDAGTSPKPDPDPGPGPGPNPGPGPRPDPSPDPGPNPGPDPGPNPGPDPGPNPGPDPKPDPDPGPGPGPGPGPWDPETPPVPVPEPTTLVLVGLGAAGGLARHLRNRRNREQ